MNNDIVNDENQVKHKYRIKFSKLGNVKFVGHLDVLNIFHRAIKRARIPIAYSQGFNPHQKTSFAIPLPLGMESVTEYVDIILTEQLEPKTIVDNLNLKMPIGMEVLEAKKLEDGASSSASSVYIGEYEVILPTEFDANVFSNELENYLLQTEILVERISKKKGRNIAKEIDIRPEIFDIQLLEQGRKLKLLISTGSIRNLKPDILIASIFGFMKMEYEKHKFHYKRIGLYGQNKEEL